MAKITALEQAEALTGAEFLPIVQGPDTKRVSMGAFRDLITPFLQYWYKGERGLSGASNNTRADLARLKDADPVDLTSLYDGALWTWEEGNFNGLADNHFITASDHVPVTQGAWKRQVSRIDVVAAGAVGDGVTIDYVAIVRAMAALPATGGTVVFPDGYKFVMGATIYTGRKPIVFEIGTSTIILPPNAHGFVLQANGSGVRGRTRWGAILRHSRSDIVYPDVATTLAAGSLASVTISGGSNVISTPVALVDNSPAPDKLAKDAGVIATIGNGTVASLAIVAPGADYIANPAVSFLAGGAAAVMIDGVQGCEVHSFTTDFNQQPGTVALLQRGCWWSNVHSLDALYNTATGVSSEHHTSVGLVVDSYTRGEPGASGDYGGVYVCNYSNLRFARRAAIGHDTSTFTTLSFTCCDIPNTFFHGGVGITEVNPVAQGERGTTFYHLINVDALTQLGGDFENAGTWYQFIGSCSNIRPINVLAYAASGTRWRGQPGTGSRFDFAKSNSSEEPLWIGSTGSTGIAYQNAGWLDKHRIGMPFSGDAMVMSSNIKLLGPAGGILDDPTRSGLACIMQSGRYSWRIAYPGDTIEGHPDQTKLAEFAYLDASGLSLPGSIKIAGKTVIEKQQPELPPAAHDLPSGLTLMNAMRAGLVQGGNPLFAGS